MRSDASRRLFLKGLGAGTAATLLTTGTSQALPRFKLPSVSLWPFGDKGIPPHREVDLPGLHAYADRQTVRAGETIRFMVSSESFYRLSIFRLGRNPNDPAGDELVESHKLAKAARQPIHPGSYIHVPDGIRGKLTQLTLECWVRPWNGKHPQAILSQQDQPSACFFELGLNSNLEITFYLGNGKQFRPNQLLVGPALEPRKWHHLVGTWDGLTKRLFVNGRMVAHQNYWADLLPANREPLRIGAAGRSGKANHFLDGDISMPAIYGRALAEAEILERFQGEGLRPPQPAELLAHWPLDEERGLVVRDTGLDKRSGRIVNSGTWMIGGPAFKADLPRFGEYNPSMDERRGHGLRLASDDLYDCRWETSHEFKVPKDARPGVYSARFDYKVGVDVMQYDVSFIVRSHEKAPPAPILVLCSTNTWRAYSGTPFFKNEPGLGKYWDTSGRANSHELAPAYNFYRDHAAGQPNYQMGTRMPWPAAGPYAYYSKEETQYSHLTRAERFLHVWLEEQGFDFDLADDLDATHDPDLFQRHKVVIICGHSEYWSSEAYEGLERFLKQGGDLVSLSGNTMFWRVSHDRESGILECRKFEPSIGGRPAAPVGELWHSLDGKRGGLMRECGQPAWRLTGLECVGWWAPENSGVYTVEQPSHFLFQQPESVPVVLGQTFGHGPEGSPIRAVGHEADIRLSTLAAMTKNLPGGVRLPEEPAGITTLAASRRSSFRGLNYFGEWENMPNGTLAEIIYWERPDGGRVFSSGAIATAWAMSVDKELSLLLKNVLRHFGVPSRG